MDPEIVRQQQQAEHEASHALRKSSSAADHMLFGRAALLFGAQRLVHLDSESWSLMTEQFERIAHAPLSTANLMADFGVAAAQYMNLFVQIAGAMAFGPANFFFAPRAFSPFGMTPSNPWWPAT